MQEIGAGYKLALAVNCPSSLIGIKWREAWREAWRKAWRVFGILGTGHFAKKTRFFIRSSWKKPGFFFFVPLCSFWFSKTTSVETCFVWNRVASPLCLAVALWIGRASPLRHCSAAWLSPTNPPRPRWRWSLEPAQSRCCSRVQHSIPFGSAAALGQAA